MRCFNISDNVLFEVNEDDISLLNSKNSLYIISPDEIDLIKDIDKLSKYAIKECKLSSHHLRIENHKEYIYGSLSVIELKGKEIGSIDFNFFLTKNTLLIVSINENKLLKKYINNITDIEYMQSYEEINPQMLLIHLINNIIENNENSIDKIEDDLEELQEKILNNALKEYSKDIIIQGRMIMQLKHRISSFPCLIKTLYDNDYGMFDERQLKLINILDFKMTRMVDNATLLRDYVAQAREAFESERDMKTNELMKVFTIITSIFLPLTLIAGWYGMNFTTMPELTWQYGYTYAIILSWSVIIILMLFFRKKKLLN